MFLKNITLLELHNVEITKSFFLKTTSGELFFFSKAQHPIHRFFRIIYSNFIEIQSDFHPTKLPLNFDSTLIWDSPKVKCNEMQRGAASVANLDRREMGLDFKHV